MLRKGDNRLFDDLRLAVDQRILEKSRLRIAAGDDHDGNQYQAEQREGAQRRTCQPAGDPCFHRRLDLQSAIPAQFAR